MVFHYVVGYDSDTDGWFVEFDSEAYFPDGHVWNDSQADEFGYGWTTPEDDSDEETVDRECLRFLNSMLDSWHSMIMPRQPEPAS